MPERRCIHCGAPRESSIHAVGSGNFEIRNAAHEYVEKPMVVCLCGSTRFMEAFFDEGWRLTLEGCIVLSVGVVKTADADGGHGAEMLGQDVADRLDELHLRKIDLADEVLVLNVGGYIGESTRREIEYAKAHGKPVRYLEAGK